MFRTRPKRGRDAGPVATVADPQLAEVRRWVEEARRIVVLTGAGISTDSGIPDFRGPQGVWTRNPAAEKAATLQDYLGDAEVRRAAWRNRLDAPTWKAEPNAGHRALVVLERRGKLDTLVTQNIDELHQRAGTDPARVVELHGTAHRTMCWTCGDRRPMPELLDRVRAGEDDPRCLVARADGERCGGIIKSATISFGQQLVAEDIARAERAAGSCDLLLAVGSTLTVTPAAYVVPIAKEAGARVVIVNAQPTAYDQIADAVITGSISEVLPAIVGEDPAP
jgi:NAD-dependent deacetylase